MQTVKIHSNENLLTKIYVGKSEIKKVRSVEFNQSVDTVPAFTFETLGFPDIEIDNPDIRFRFTPETVTDAVKVLRHSLIADKELYNAFVASIASALKEIPAGTGLYDVAEAVADRIIGR